MNLGLTVLKYFDEFAVLLVFLLTLNIPGTYETFTHSRKIEESTLLSVSHCIDLN